MQGLSHMTRSGYVCPRRSHVELNNGDTDRETRYVDSCQPPLLLVFARKEREATVGGKEKQ